MIVNTPQPDPDCLTPVYVDPLANCLMSKQWRWPQSCHLFVDANGDLDALHDFARRIGLKRGWFQQSASGLPHYDLNDKKRKVAVERGAIELDRRDSVMVWRRWRELKPRPLTTH